ncbi:MFS transporter [Streptomyces sp. NPDC127108]|uniref:MFS transporter n=1 Tax=Streptomyces sp. NPDC127108 TaxID=3345361 RepID=UPI00362779E6
MLRWLCAYAASVTGDVVYFTVLTWAATRAAGPAQAGVVLAAGAVPRAVLMLAGGVLADRAGPRRVLIGSDVVRCVAVLGAAALTYTGRPGLWPLLALAVVFGAVDAVFMPAVGALPPRLTSAGQLARVQGMRTLAVRLGNAVGPLVAAAVLAGGGAAAGFGAVGLLFVVSVWLLAAVRVPGPAEAEHLARAREPERTETEHSAWEPRDRPAASPWQDLRAGLRHLRDRPRLSRLVLLVALGEMCFSGPTAAGLVLLADEREWGASALGWILSAFSLGGAATGVALTVIPRVPRAHGTLVVSLTLTAALVTTLGRLPDAEAAVACAALLGAASGVAMVLGNALLQEETEPRYMGRVTSVTTLCTLGLGPLLFPLVGLTAAAWGTGAFFAACGVVCLAAAVIGLSPALRGARG